MKQTVNIPQLGVAMQNSPVVGDPSVGTKAENILRFVSEAHSELANIRQKLFGDSEAGRSSQNQLTCVNGILEESSTQIACLVGELKTINNLI